jgi:hypothetical protein
MGSRQGDAMLTVIEKPEIFEIQSRMQKAKRVVLALLALFPLIAPWELLIKPDWTEILHPFFFFMAMISAGAVAVSLMFAWAALAGLDSLMRFDRGKGVFTWSVRAPIVTARKLRRPIGEIANLRTATHDWTEGSPSFTLQVELTDGTVLKSGSSWSRNEIDGILQRLSGFLGMPTHD